MGVVFEARDPALGPMLDPAPGPAASETMQSVIDSLLTRSHERRSAHKRLLAQQDADQAAPDEAIGQADAEPSSAATGTALPDPVPESSAVAPAAAARPSGELRPRAAMEGTAHVVSFLLLIRNISRRILIQIYIIKRNSNI